MKTQMNPSVAAKPVSGNFLNELAEMHTAEKELTLALPLVAKAAKSKDLKTLLQFHLKETKGHVKTIEAVADSLKKDLPKKSCKPMTALIKEAVKVMAKKLGSPELDAALIAVGQKIEQFEIDAYTALCSHAQEMELTHENALLESTLDQEKLAYELLGGLASKTAPLKKLVEKVSLEKAGARVTA